MTEIDIAPPIPPGIDQAHLVEEVRRQLSLIEATAVLAFAAALMKSTEGRHPWIMKAAKAYVRGEPVEDSR